MPAIRVDLYSDTQTRPTAAMRRAIAEAEVGDEQRGEDPTVNRLQERVAALLGKEAALFLPSGTMCNEIAVKVHTRPGDEVVADRTAHVINFEAGAAGLISGVQVTPIDGERGVFSAEQLAAAIRPPSRYAPPTRLVWVENTSNLGGGTVWPLTRIEQVCAVARERGVPAHLDGARLMNAAVASGVSAAAFAAPFDSAWIDFTKGLGAPVGACLAGSRAFIEEAWRYKQALGGAMRQSGIIAAAGLYALDCHVERLADDHANARRLADGLAGIPGIGIDPETVETNLVFFDVANTGIGAAEWTARLAEHGIRMGAMGPTRVRAVTHLDVSAEGIEQALAAARTVR